MIREENDSIIKEIEALTKYITILGD